MRKFIFGVLVFVCSACAMDETVSLSSKPVDVVQSSADSAISADQSDEPIDVAADVTTVVQEPTPVTATEPEPVKNPLDVTCTADSECPVADTVAGMSKCGIYMGGAHPTVSFTVYNGTCNMQTGLCQIIGGLKTCDDSNWCTADSCSIAGDACAFPPIDTAPCNDGDVCTQNDICKGGECVSAQPLSCDDKNPCSIDSCEEGVGCTHKADWGKPCNDGNFCTLNDMCTGNGPSVGTCEGFNDDTCNDGNPCTADKCWSMIGCKHEIDLEATCTDEDPCTADICTNGVCVSKALALDGCNDGNSCTADSCIKGSGCAHVMQWNKPCDDANACTLDEVCSGIAAGDTFIASTCHSKSFLDCDDGNSCTMDYCSVVKGCLHNFASPTMLCEDGNVCTYADFCESGVCKTGKSAECNDGDATTVDSCNPKYGCVHDNFTVLATTATIVTDMDDNYVVIPMVMYLFNDAGVYNYQVRKALPAKSGMYGWETVKLKDICAAYVLNQKPDINGFISTSPVMFTQYMCSSTKCAKDLGGYGMKVKVLTTADEIQFDTQPISGNDPFKSDGTIAWSMYEAPELKKYCETFTK